MGGRMDCHVITQISRVYRLLLLLAMVLHFARLARGSSRYYTIKEKKTRRFWKRPKILSVLGFFNETHSYQHIPNHYYFGKPGAQLHS